MAVMSSSARMWRWSSATPEHCPAVSTDALSASARKPQEDKIPKKMNVTAATKVLRSEFALR